MIPILAEATGVANQGALEVLNYGENVIVDKHAMAIAGVYLFLIMLPLLFLLALLFYKKKFQHQQILAAMEKGVPVSDLVARPLPSDRAINWVRSLSLGIGFLFIGIALAAYWLWVEKTPGQSSIDRIFLILPIVVFGLGLIFLLRGILQKNIEKK